jgi:hypothetical protein
MDETWWVVQGMSHPSTGDGLVVVRMTTSDALLIFRRDDADYLSRAKAFEKEHDAAFGPLPFHYIEVSRLLLSGW